MAADSGDDKLAPDHGLELLLTDRRVWSGLCLVGGRAELVYLIPSLAAGWHVGVNSSLRDEVYGSQHPMRAAAVAPWLKAQGIGQAAIDAADWKPSDDYQPGDPNPFMAGRTDHRYN